MGHSIDTLLQFASQAEDALTSATHSQQFQQIMATIKQNPKLRALLNQVRQNPLVYQAIGAVAPALLQVTNTPNHANQRANNRANNRPNNRRNNRSNNVNSSNSRNQKQYNMLNTQFGMNGLLNTGPRLPQVQVQRPLYTI